MVWSLYKMGTDQDKPYDEMTILYIRMNQTNLKINAADVITA